MSCAIFRTGLRATHVVLRGDLVPAATVLVTPALDINGGRNAHKRALVSEALGQKDVGVFFLVCMFVFGVVVFLFFLFF